MRFNCPIYTYEEIIEEAGIILGELETEKRTPSATSSSPSGKKAGDLAEYSTEELQTMLDDAIETENYIDAAKLRDELAKRGK